MRPLISTRIAWAALSLIFLTSFSTAALGYVANPDLTATGVIAALKSDPYYSSRPYSETYNLGATGLRGWIYIDSADAGADGLITAPSRQILVTVASAPASAVMAVDDVILGAMAGSTGTVPAFTSDCRKAFGVAIGDAEKTGAGTLRVKRWRAGTTTDVNIPMTIMGNYTSTAPYSCPKSALILANARIKLVSELKADPNFLGYGYGGAINGLALLASVAPGDADYAYVQTRLKSFADALAGNGMGTWGQETWSWSYMSIFLSEYYLRTVADGAPDASILGGISRYTVAIAKGQSRYGTFGHGMTPAKPDGSLHGTVTPYGPMNAAGIPSNIAIIMGKKALVAGGQTIDPEIDPAIQRGLDFLSYYMNKGSIPYGEHEPWAGGHASNGKDPMCAVLFGLQDTRPAEAEYFARMSVAGCTGREYGHTGQGFSYLWGAMGANMGGPTAIAKYMENIRWHLDLVRRTDGSFSYDGQEQYGGGNTADGTYLGACGYYDINPTATYILSFGVSLQRLYITGRNAIPANTLSPAKVTNAIAAATYKQDCPAFTTAQLLADLSAYDPVVRNSAAAELVNRTLTTTQLNNLIASITNGTLSSDPSTRMGACQALGARQATGALTALGQRLSDTDLWVRGKAAQALRNFPSAVASAQRDTMLTAFAANATDPEVIVWNDPVQIANNFLSFALFGDGVYGGNNIASYTIAAPKNLLYPAVKAGLKQPDSNPRLGVCNFANGYLTLADAQALTPDLFAAATTEALADTMWHGEARAVGIIAVAKFKPVEAISVALSMMDIPPGYGWGAQHFQISALNVLSSYGDAARWTLPALRQRALTWDSGSPQYPVLNTTIASIEAAITSPDGIINLVAVANPQVVVTPVSTAKAITLTGSSPRGAVTFSNVTTPIHGTLTGTAPNLIYTPTADYTGPDHFTFKVADTLTTSETGTVSIIMGTAGTGLKGEYFDNSNYTNLKLTRTDQQVNFDWGTGSPDPSVGADTFSVRWSGLLLVPETGSYTFSTLNSDGARLFINGIPVLDDYVDQTTSWKDGTPVSLTAGQRVELQMEYYENTGSAVAKLKWSGPSLAGVNGSIIAKEWLYDGTGITNRTPYAHAQSVTLIQNATQAVTLTGSGAGLTPLVYSVITQPVHGTLTGVAPNLTYTPAANYSGSDSFTFLVNNGFSNSSPATVSIGIWSGSPTSYFWTNAVAGNWSGAFWSNATGGAVTPAAAGNSFYSLNFNQSGTYTTTQDLNNNYVFNQLNLASNVTFDGTNSLSPTGNGPLLPQINQNSASVVSINTPINLAAMTTFGGVGGGPIYMPGVISGPGGVNKDGPGTLQIHGISPNPYSGGTIVNGGTLHLGGFIGGNSIDCVNPVGTGPVSLNNGTIYFDRVSTNNALIVNGGALYTPNGWGATWSGAITLNATLTVYTPYALNCSGAISGAGGFYKVSEGPLVLSGNNSFTGANQIAAGTLQCNTASSLGTGTLNITNGANVYLNYTGSRTIAALTYNSGAPLAPGTYGSTSSPATNKNNSYFSGTGTITILPASSTALSLSSGSTPSNVGAPLTFTATVTGTAPTGNVAFYAGATLLGSGTLNGSFQASFTTSSLAVGSYSITAKYEGNASNAASTSAALAIEITSLLAAPPTNLVAVRGMNSVSVGLTWTVSAGATGYNVKRALTNGGPYTTIGTSVGANYNDLTALGSTRYYYMVSATNASGESANSASVSVMPYVPSSTKDILTFVFPGLPAASISETSISITLPFGTSVTALAPTYTVSANATGSPASGTPRNFSTPQTYTITAEDNSTKIYTVTVTVLPDSVPPVTSGLVLRMDASKITGIANGAQLNTWADTSGAANNAIRQGGSSAGFPMYVTGALNGQPVVRFNSGNATGDSLKFTRISTIQTVFWVFKENAGLSGSRFLLGDDTTYQFHRASANGPLWHGYYTDNNIKNGTTKLMGNVIDGTSTSLPSGSFQVVSLVTTGNVQANSICQDRTSHGSWQGDIAEILIYNRALTSAEELQVGSYLSAKYALPTAYLMAPTGVSATPASSGAISVSWLDVPGATSYSVSYKTTVGGTEQVVTGVAASPTIVSGLTNGTSYDFKVAATNATGTSAYSSIVSATPSGSSTKDILTFVFPSQPVTTISGTNISVTVPFGTSVTALAPTYTVSANATGSPVSGTPRNFSTPQTYTITAEDNSTKIYTVTVTVLPDSVPPVTSGLVLRMDASKITGIANGAQLNTWADTSGAANNAIRQSGSSAGYPMYVADVLNGKPVVRFNSGNSTGDSLKFTRISTIQTVFWVLKENAGVSDGHFLLGDDSTYQFHRKSANGPLWDGGYADNNIKNGTTKLMGNTVDGTATSLPSGSFQVVSLVTAGNVQANQICQDRTAHGSWQGDIAEILIYNRALTGAEELQVGGYLSAKYALSTAYPTMPTGVTATPASPGAISVSWLEVPGATSYSVSYKTTVGGTEQVVTGVSASPYIVSGLTNGTSYDFKVAATNAVGTSVYSSMVSATPSGSSAKDILTFVFPGQPATTISGTNISVTVPYGTSVTALAPTFTLSALATASPASGTARNFTTPQTYTVTAQDLTTQVYTVTVTVAPSPFSTWASNPAQGLTAGVNDGPLADPDRDGISNLLEFTLGGAPMVSSQTILPTLTKNGANWVFEYNRSDLSLSPATTQVVEYGSDLAGWTAATIPTTSAGIVTITPGSPSDHVTVTIASPGAKCFVRLKVSQ